MENPAILLITGDELRKDALGCYGNRVIKTPHLDALADSGIRFDRGYCTSPWCLPSRCSILTGLFPSSSGAYSNFRKCELNGGIPNMFSVLRENGYRTAVSGKCHFAPVPYGETKPDRTLPYDEFRDYYTSLGIDDLFLQDGKEVSAWFYDDYSKEIDKTGFLNQYRKVRWNREHKKVYPFPGEAEWHPDAWTGRKMAEYIKDYERNGPAMMWLSFSGPHYPFDAPKEYYDRVDMDALAKEQLHFSEDEFRDPGRIHYKSYHGGGGIDGAGPAPDRGCKNYSREYWTNLRKSYYANVALIDDMAGDVISAAQDRWGDNLMIIFTADHGEMLGNHGIWGKHNCAYEDVWNVPLLVKYPYCSEKDTSDAKVMLTDIFATCMKETGVKGVKTDGEDFRSVIEKGGHKYVYAEGEGYLAVSNGRYKYIHIKKPNEEYYELIDLETDPYEYNNLIDHPDHCDELVRLERQAITHFINKLLP